jgi:hypothetical protein
MNTLFHLVSFGLLAITSTSSERSFLSLDSAKTWTTTLPNDNFLCYMQTSDGKTLNLEDLCQPGERKEKKVPQQENSSTEDNSSDEDNPDIDTSSNRPDRANSSENESNYPSDESEEEEP